MTETAKYRYDSDRQDYLTPPEFINGILEKFKRSEFDLDVCCTKKNIPAKEHYIYPEFDGLELEWKKLNWCNPPFRYTPLWVKKAYEEQKKGHQTLMLIPARTEMKYFHYYILGNDMADITFLRKGLRFLDPETNEPMGVYKNALALIYFV